jgi:hypothetical protein
MGLILDSHPLITNVDEDRFKKINPEQIIKENEKLEAISFKLPPRSADLDFIKFELEASKLIWMIRDPRGVVASMVTLPVKVEGIEMMWVDRFAEVEINRMLRLYPVETLSFLQDDLENYREISCIPYHQRSFEQKYQLGAICWKMKQQALSLYRLNDISFSIVKFEDLVTNPENILRKLLEYLEIGWDANVLRHHELHKGVSIGLTQNDKKIDPGIASKYLHILNDKAIADIHKICGPTAAEFGYQLSVS